MFAYVISIIEENYFIYSLQTNHQPQNYYWISLMICFEYHGDRGPSPNRFGQSHGVWPDPPSPVS